MIPVHCIAIYDDVDTLGSKFIEWIDEVDEDDFIVEYGSEFFIHHKGSKLPLNTIVRSKLWGRYEAFIFMTTNLNYKHLVVTAWEASGQLGSHLLYHLKESMLNPSMN